jgi:uncharacterized protein (UPF0333 family)
MVEAHQKIREFLLGNKGQGAIEYILLVGGAVLAFTVVLGKYSEMVDETGFTLRDNTYDAVDEIQEKMNAEINKMT